MECRDCGAVEKLWKITADYVNGGAEEEFHRGDGIVHVECRRGHIDEYTEQHFYCEECAQRMLDEYYWPTLRYGSIKSVSIDPFYNRPIAKRINALRIKIRCLKLRMEDGIYGQM